MASHVGLNDHLIHEALRSGDLTVDTATGTVTCGGKQAHFDQHTGYMRLAVERRPIFAHRVVWIAAHGPIPDGFEINHANSTRTDNRLANLELVNRSGNQSHRHGSRYVAVGRTEGEHVVDPEWFAQVMTLAERGDVSREEIQALLPDREEAPAKPYGRQPLSRLL